MRVDENEVRRIARLARLSIEEAEVPIFASELTAILEYVDQIRDEPNVAGATSLAGVPLREDQIEPSLPTDDLRANAPSFERDLFVVPRVIAGG